MKNINSEVFQLIRIKNIRSAQMVNIPYKWGKISNIFEDNIKNYLIESFPEDAYKQVVNREGDKCYNMFYRQGYNESSQNIDNGDNYSIIWSKLIQEIKSKEYRMLLSEISGINLINTKLEINFWKYTKDCFLSPHVDKREKIVTQLIYFNENWNTNWGGHFCIHKSDNGKTIVERIEPIIDNSIILITSDKSWHSVSPIITDLDIIRRSLQIVFFSH